MIAYAIFVLCIIMLYLNHLKIIKKMQAKHDYDPNKVLAVALIIAAGVSLFIAFIVIDQG